MIYRILLALTFLVFFILIMQKNSKQNNFLQAIIDLLKHYYNLIWLPFKSGAKTDSSSLQRIKSALLGLSGCLFLLMAVTGFIPVLIAGSPLTGIPLMIHVTLAPLFVVSMALGALFYAKTKQFDKNDLAVVEKTAKKSAKNSELIFLSKVSFWLLLVLSVPAILSIVLSMYPLFSLAGIEVMAHIHGYSILLMFIVTFVYFIKKIETQLANKR